MSQHRSTVTKRTSRVTSKPARNKTSASVTAKRKRSLTVKTRAAR